MISLPVRQSNTTHHRPALTFTVIACILAIMLGSPTRVLGENTHINFQNLLENKDIALGEVRAFLQDSQGFMWFGGQNALLRYDGYTFKQIDQYLETSLGLKKTPILSISHLYEDSQKIIWISTQWGLLKFDPTTENVSRIPNNSDEPIRLSDTFIESVLETSSKQLLVMTTLGLAMLDRTTDRYTFYTPDPQRENAIKGKRICCALKDKQGKIWLGTDVGLQKFDLNRRHFTLYKPYTEHPNAIPENHITALALDKKGNFWVGTQKGLIYFHPERGMLDRHVHNPQDSTTLGRDDIWEVIIDSEEQLWVATDSGGLNRLNKTNNTFVRFMHEPGKFGTLNSNVVRTVFEDNNRDIWVGNFPNGVNFFDRSSAAISSFINDPNNDNSLSHNSVLTVKEDNKGNLWLGTDGGGVEYLDRKTNTFTHYTHDPANKNSVSSNAILTSYIDSENKLWVGTWAGGVSIFDPKTGNWDRLPFNSQYSSSESVSQSSALNSAHVWSINEDRQGFIWITTHDGGLSRYKRQSKQFTHYIAIKDDPHSITREIAWTSFEDSTGRFWVGTSTGLNTLDRETNKFKHYLSDSNDITSLSNLSVFTIFEDSKKRLWFGTEGGLNLYNPDQDNFTRYTKEDGFNNDTIRSITEDRDGNLWLSTNNGVIRFNPNTKNIKNYQRDSGRLMGGFNRNAGLLSREGEVIFGSVGGLKVFDPQGLSDNTYIPPIALTELRILADKVTVGAEDGLLQKSVNFQEEIRLDYKKSMFEFSFTALNYRDSEKNSYAYKLEGFDEDWLQVGNQRKAKYTNLDAGTYTFIVKGSNNDGLWNEKGKSIIITQEPPPWLTWWAYTLYTLALVAIIILFVQSQRRKRKLVEEQNRILEIKVAERTAELRQKNYDVQAMLSNMRQGLFTIQDTGLIHPEYSQYLEIIFETTQISGRQYLELLFDGSNLGENILSQIKEGVTAVIQEDELNFEFNAHLFITEYETLICGRKKILSLDWNPIVIDDVITKIMVSVRDVTQLKLAEAEAAEQKRELDIISQLLNISSKKFTSFEDSVNKFIKQNRVKIKSCSTPNDDIIALLFRNMHTIKGNCRTYGFSHLSEISHRVETTYGELKEPAKREWNSKELLAELELVEKGMAEYSDIYRRVLGRDGTVVREGGVWLDDKTIASISDSIMNMQKHFGLQPASQELKPLKSLLEGATSSSLEEVLSDIIASLPSIAQQLGKPAPIMKIDSGTFRIKEEAYELINNVFSHIFRNCLDHGLEDTQERIDKKKRTTGTINIACKQVNDALAIHIHDDGRGLNIYHLFTIGVQLGLWRADSKPHDSDIAEIIFRSGVSTTKQVTDISGRGVGMDAAKQYLIENGGSIELKLLAEKQRGVPYVPFEMIIILPSKYFSQGDT